MPDGSDDTSSTQAGDYRRGDQLVYLVRASGSLSAPEVARHLAHLAEAHDLGEWSISPIGIGLNSAYLDLELRKDISKIYLKLVIGLDPDVY